MSLFLLIIALLLALVSAIGAFNKYLPGPVLTFIAVLVSKWAGMSVDDRILWITLTITVLTVVSGYFLPGLAVRHIGGTKAGFRGAAIATIIVFICSVVFVSLKELSTISILILSDKLLFGSIMAGVALIGSFIGELVKFHHLEKIVQDSLGSALAYILGSGAKLLYSYYVILYIVLDIIILVYFQ